MEKNPIPSYDFYKDFEKSLPFEICRLENPKNLYDTDKAHRHNYYEIICFTKGSGKHFIDFKSFPVKSNSVHFISPGQVHLVRRSADSDGYVIMFTIDFYSLNLNNKDILFDLPFFNNNSSKPILSVSASQFNVFSDVINKMNAEFFSENLNKEEILRSYLNIFLINENRLFEPEEAIKSTSSSNVELVKNFNKLIEKNFIEKHKVSDYAAMLFISPGHLNENTGKVLGKTASELIHERLILEIKRMLFHSNQTIDEIAFSLNFEDPAYFGRFFKKHQGTSPGSFRRDIRQKYQ